ncbi:SRPBCC family protein [Pseudoroseicyclus tamaricis]|uniref:SRPBCC family protein n=1 Tax=Pseudoroseicyclus tamaricis TaxID=2705421 RepID=A0A6B2JYJ1_9RHOB|nr:SRPBCC family protein [Pseudoroseicyclus tamaricis]NDV00432.1 SRPBCC family protein [Pseudoroseicyclus tamaricis]
MFKRIMRQRRRLFVGIAGVMAGAILLFGPGLAAQLSALAMALCSALIVSFAPRFRHWVEALAFGVPTGALLPVDADVRIGVILLTTVIFQRFFSGRSLDGLPFRVSLSSARSVTVDAPPRVIWTRLIPGESHPEDHWTGTLIDFDHDPEDPETLHLRYRNPAGLFDEVTVTFLERAHPRHCRFYIERSEGDYFEEAVMDLRFIELEEGQTLIESHLCHEPLPLRAALARWLDDAFGDEWDSFAASVSRRTDWSLHRLAQEGMAGKERSKGDARVIW